MTSFIRALRERDGVSQEDIAKEIGVSRPTYIQIENGSRDITVPEARKFADFFGMSLDDFLSERESIDPQVSFEKAEKKKVAQEVRISVPQKNVRKFKEALLYIIEQIGARVNVGEAVICKLLYFIDFDFYEKYEEQLIGATYIRNHHGPTPAEFQKIIEDMQKNKELVKLEKKYYKYPQKKYLPLRKPDLSVFSGKELELIDFEIARFEDKNAKDMEVMSHRDVPWITAEHLQPIDYESVFYRTPEFSVRQYDDEL